jgi:hypothetical protein
MVMIDAPSELCWSRLCERHRGMRRVTGEEQVYGAGVGRGCS